MKVTKRMRKLLGIGAEDVQRLCKARIPQFVGKLEDATTIFRHGKNLLWVGMHPDQATGAIVEIACQRGEPFAVVPCCVFSDDFPEREVDGRRVRTHDDLISWIRKWDDKIEVEYLDFSGKNVVVFRR